MKKIEKLPNGSSRTLEEALERQYRRASREDDCPEQLCSGLGGWLLKFETGPVGEHRSVALPGSVRNPAMRAL